MTAPQDNWPFNRLPKPVPVPAEPFEPAPFVGGAQ